MMLKTGSDTAYIGCLGGIILMSGFNALFLHDAYVIGGVMSVAGFAAYIWAIHRGSEMKRPTDSSPTQIRGETEDG